MINDEGVLKDDDLPLDDQDQATYLLHNLSEKVRFWTIVAGHLLMRLEAVTPESCVRINPKAQKLALGLPIQFAQEHTPDGDVYMLYLGADKEAVEYVRNDETDRRKRNGIGIEVVIKVGPREQKSGLVDITGKELPSAQPGRTTAGGTGTAGEVS